MEDNKSFTDYVDEYKKKISELSPEEKEKRDLYLKRLGPRPKIKDLTPELIEEIEKNIPEGEQILGPTTMYASIDKPWLYKYKDEDITAKVENKSFYGYAFDCLKDYMDGIAFDFGGYSPSVKEVFQNICRFEEMFRNEKGIKAGDMVCVAPVNQPESLYTIYALNKIGAKVSIIDPRANSYTLKQDILGTKPKPKMLVSSSTAVKALAPIEEELGLEDIMLLPPLESHPNKMLKGVVGVLGSSKMMKKYNYLKSFKKYKKKQYSEEDFGKYEPKTDDTFDFIMHTGGTTGVHKGVEITGYAFNNTVMEHNALMDSVVSRGSVLVNPMPEFITYGMTTMHLAFCKGFKQKMLLVPTNKAFVDAIIDSKAELAYGSPVFWEAFIKSEKAKKADLSFLKVPVAGGEKINMTTKTEVNEFLNTRGCTNVLIDGYGLSEVTGVFSVALNDNTIGTQGHPLAHNNVGIYDRETGVELQIGQTGEAYVTSESMMEEYHQNDDENGRVLVDDNGTTMIKTGDAGSINELGELNIAGRYKRIFVCGVDKVYQERMEEIICELPFVEKAVVTRIPVYNKDTKAVPKVHIVIKEEYIGKMTEKEMEFEISNIVQKKISSNVIPKFFEFQSEILYTPNGKVDFARMTKEDQIKLNQDFPQLVRPFEEVDQFASTIDGTNENTENNTEEETEESSKSR